MPYTAKITRAANRTFFSIDFRHPAKKDRAGRFGLKVRRGLATSDADLAARYLAEMNALLADESLHRPTARADAALRFSPVVVDAFYRDLEPMPSSLAADRDRQLPIPSRQDGFLTALLIGTTGSGKSTLVRQFLGTDPATERFPSTAPGRTTVADQEFILRPDGDYQAVVSFLPADLIAAKVEDALVEAALAHLHGRPPYEVARLMLSPREGRFRLSYILGSAHAMKSTGPHNLDVDGEEDDDEATPAAAPPRPSRVAEFTHRLIALADQGAAVAAAARGVAVSELFTGADRDSVEQDIDMALRDAEDSPSHLFDLIDDVRDEIALRFADITVGSYERHERHGGEWPRAWSLRLPAAERGAFLAALRPFTGINAARHGALLTPLVEGVRVSGPFQPEWMKGEPVRLVLIDGEGVGHNPETLRSLPGTVTNRIAAVDRVLLVDSAKQPMLDGPTLVARTLERMGESAKLFVCFTHVDEMRGAENLPTLADKAAHVRDAARDVLHHLAREFGRARLPDLERAFDERTFFAAGIDAVVREGTDGSAGVANRAADRMARYSRTQLAALARALGDIPPAPADVTAPLYDLDNVVMAIAAAAGDYIETYRALLKLPSRRSLSPVPWQTAKAATRYASQYGLDGYGAFRPAADFSSMLGERLARFLASPILFDPANATADAKERATAQVRQALAKRLDPWIRQRLIAAPLPLWNRAYDHRGAGSTRLRALDIDVLNVASVPPSSEEGDAESSAFQDAVKALVVESILDGGGRIHPRPTVVR